MPSYVISSTHLYINIYTAIPSSGVVVVANDPLNVSGTLHFPSDIISSTSESLPGAGTRAATRSGLAGADFIAEGGEIGEKIKNWCWIFIPILWYLNHFYSRIPVN